MAILCQPVTKWHVIWYQLSKYPSHSFPSLLHFFFRVFFLFIFFLVLFFLWALFMASDDEASNHDFIHNESLTNKSTRKDPATDPRNPYYVHPDNNPNVVLVALPLNDHNNNNWSRSMHRALTSKKKIIFINRTLLKPPFKNPNFELWDRINSTVLSWINHTLSPPYCSKHHLLWLCFRSLGRFAWKIYKREPFAILWSSSWSSLNQTRFINPLAILYWTQNFMGQTWRFTPHPSMLLSNTLHLQSRQGRSRIQTYRVRFLLP